MTTIARRRSHERPRWPLPRITVVIVSVVAAGLVPLAPPSSAAEEVGVQGPSYSPISAPTGQKPQSKLWFAQSSWWGVLFDSASGDYTIHRFDWTSSTWADTGVFVDNRNAANSDALWDGASLYVATAVRPGASASDHHALLRRYHYDVGAGTYRLDDGFPVAVADAPMEAIVVDKDTTGALWITWTAPNDSGGRKVYVTHTTTDDTVLVAPYVLPTPGASNLTSDDISAVVAFRSQIGVMWSNQNDNAVYFATHSDGAPDSAWQESPALQGPRYADDHINVKSLQADASGEVFAAVKTELTNDDAPLVLLLVLKEGSWTRHTFGTVADDHTRPLVLIDSESRQLYMFAAAPCCSGGTIYMKKTALDNISFPSGLGTAFISNGGDSKVNNPTSTKQSLDSTTGLVVLAGDDGIQHYFHNTIALGSVVDTHIDSGPSGTVPTGEASFTFSSTSEDATFECALDQSEFAACTAPVDYVGLADGPHTFEVRAVDPTGVRDPTPASRTWTVDVASPVVIGTSPADGDAAVSQGTVVTATFSEAMAETSLSTTTFTLVQGGSPSTVEATVSYDATARIATLRPQEPLDLATSYTAVVKGGDQGVRDSAGTPMAADAVWSFTTVATDTEPPQTLLSDSGPSGTVDTSSATFSFTADEKGSTFECQLDGAPFALCASPASYVGLADGDHRFEVRAVDAAGNTDATPASRAWTVAATVLADGFESGDFSRWTSVQTGATGTATVQGDVVRSGAFAALLSATSSANSFAYIRSDLPTAHTDLSVSGQLRMVDESGGEGEVPIVKLSGADGTLVTVLRANQSGELRARYAGSTYSTTGRIPLDTWAGVSLRVVTAGSGGGTVEILLEGALVYRSTAAALGTSGVGRVQIGSDHKRRSFTLAVDEVTIRG